MLVRVTATGPAVIRLIHSRGHRLYFAKRKHFGALPAPDRSRNLGVPEQPARVLSVARAWIAKARALVDLGRFPIADTVVANVRRQLPVSFFSSSSILRSSRPVVLQAIRWLFPLASATPFTAMVSALWAESIGVTSESAVSCTS
jgi:hypothetical protein